MASRLPNSVASARAAVGPTWRIDSATSTRHSGCALALSRLASSRLPLADSSPALVVNSSVRSRSSLGEGEQVALVGDDPGLQQRDRRLVAEALDVERAAAGDVEHPLPQLRRAVREFGQRMSASPSLAGASVVPHSGHVVGMTNSRSVPSRRSTTGPSTSGITSPALRITTVSPISTPLRLTSDALCRVARLTVEPATLTGSMKANGVTRPVRPTLTLMSSSLVVRLLGRVLVGDRPARRPRRGAEPALQRDLVDFDHHAVDFVFDVVAVLAPVGDAFGDRVDALAPAWCARTPAAPTPSARGRRRAACWG